MKQKLINDVINDMLLYLNNAQMEKLQMVMQHVLFDYEITNKTNEETSTEQDFVEMFLSAKRIEGCSEKSLKYYKATIDAMVTSME